MSAASRKAHAELVASRCDECKGFGISLTAIPAERCRSCGGTGKRAAPTEPDLINRQEASHG